MNPAKPARITAASARLSAKAEQFTESVIREMTRLAMEYDAVNLSQGFPDFPAPAEIKRAAAEAIAADINQYAITWGAKSLRDAIARKFERTQGVAADPEREITVCCGSTEAMISSMMAIINPGDEVVVFEPFYENYGPDAILSGATPRFVKLPAARLDVRSRGACRRVRPAHQGHHPEHAEQSHGKSFRARGARSDSRSLRAMECLRHHGRNLRAHALRRRAAHLLASLDGMRERTITINALSKTYSVTGWRVGWAIAPPEVSAAIRKVHDFVTVGAAAPLQEAGAVALEFPASYYESLAREYAARRDTLLGILTRAGFRCFRPRGAYYIMTDISAFGFPDDVAFARYLVKDIGVAAVPGSSFYRDPADGRTQLRFTFCKTEKTFQAAAERLARLRAAPKYS